MPRIYADDNYVQRDSVWKKCKRCGRRCKLRRSYAICDSCASAMERGEDGY